MSCKKGVLRNFAKFTGKRLCHRPVTSLKKRLWYRCFPVSFAKFLRTPFLQNTSRQLFLKKAMYKKLTYFKAWTVSKHTMCWQNNNFNIQRNPWAIVKHSNYSFNKIQLLQKRQFVNYFVKKWNTRQQNLNFYVLCPLSKNTGNMQSSLANQIAHIFTC